jgi:hypothetical protein
MLKTEDKPVPVLRQEPVRGYESINLHAVLTSELLGGEWSDLPSDLHPGERGPNISAG